MVPTFKHAVIGGGVVGLAVAAKLSEFGPTLLLEKNRFIGQECSSRNSEVIHSGIYYPSDSRKTFHCIRGQRLLYDYCAAHNVHCNRVGKWIVSTSEAEDSVLEGIRKTAAASGVQLRYLSKNEIQEEPSLRVVSALSSPNTGVINSHDYMERLEYQLTQNGGIVALGTKFENLTKNSAGSYLMEVSSPGDPNFTLLVDSVINCAGLYSDRVAKIILQEKCPSTYRLHFWKGHYFKGPSTGLLKTPRLIYPAPEENLKGLGIHLTLDTAGNVKFGPDVKYLGSHDAGTILDYRFPEGEELQKTFHRAVARYLPNVEFSRLSPDYTGIRPKLSGPGDPFRDFIISEESHLGFSGVVNMLGIESPGLTGSLSLAMEVASLLGYSE